MKKILRGRILIHGFSYPFGINFEGLDGLFLCTRHFIQIHLGVVCEVEVHTVSHFKAPVNAKVGPGGLKCGCTFM